MCKLKHLDSAPNWHCETHRVWWNARNPTICPVAKAAWKVPRSGEIMDAEKYAMAARRELIQAEHAAAEIRASTGMIPERLCEAMQLLRVNLVQAERRLCKALDNARYQWETHR